MSMSDCPKCWSTPCECGERYKDWSIDRLSELIDILQNIKNSKSKGKPVEESIKSMTPPVPQLTTNEEVSIWDGCDEPPTSIEGGRFSLEWNILPIPNFPVRILNLWKYFLSDKIRNIVIENLIYDELNVGKPITFTIVASDPNETPVHKLIDYVIDNMTSLHYGNVTYTRYNTLEVKSVAMTIVNVKLTDKFIQEFSRMDKVPTDNLRIEFEGFVTCVNLFGNAK